MKKELHYVSVGQSILGIDMSPFYEAVARGFWAQYPTADGTRHSVAYAPTVNAAMTWLAENYPEEFVLGSH